MNPFDDIVLGPIFNGIARQFGIPEAGHNDDRNGVFGDPNESGQSVHAMTIGQAQVEQN